MEDLSMQFKMINRIAVFNSSRVRLARVNADFASSIPSGSLVLDAGAGTSPYRDLFRHTHYESADFQMVDRDYVPSTYVCDLKHIPVEDARFDYIVFNQVMEHLPEPKKVLRELHRVLKPGGRMIYSGPFFFEEHEQPYDFYRYTRFGLEHLFSEARFNVEELDWLEGFFGTAAYQLNCMARFLPARPTQLGGGIIGLIASPAVLLSKLVFGVCSVVFHRIELRTKYTSKGYPKNYFAILTKSES
jgi:SAM-dependent methyltransferase